MAAEQVGENELKAHEHSYFRFVALFKWGTVACAIIAAGVVLIIAS